MFIRIGRRGFQLLWLFLRYSGVPNLFGKVFLINFEGSKKLKAKIIFVFATKIGKNTNKHFKLLFFVINLHFPTWSEISTYRKLTFPLTNNIYLEMQERLKTDQSIPHVFLICLKRNDPQTFKFKSSCCKSPFL